ncbi:uncharacterized protein LOC6581012 [Drosophila mojavensis]|uniref:Uncharacterized protein n=1 Tax=Drosophila mojavensis TaxID=7230 RepID=A0A0Q9XHY3_DROMO|nr:uncharacterized protein LOC6581012 [Drosophila mojavensis]KRG05450.1 uncharacterized protein Dmoj_GI18392 [Drosophila mojavensis]
MIYLQYCCFFVDLRIGTFIIAASEILMDICFGILIAIYGESGTPDLCHKLFLAFMILHLISAVCLLIGAIKLRPGCMLFYILMTMVKILAMIILIISDIILLIWIPVIIIYVIMFVLGIYFWFVTYSFYAALGGSLFI